MVNTETASGLPAPRHPPHELVGERSVLPQPIVVRLEERRVGRGRLAAADLAVVAALAVPPAARQGAWVAPLQGLGEEFAAGAHLDGDRVQVLELGAPGPQRGLPPVHRAPVDEELARALSRHDAVHRELLDVGRAVRDLPGHEAGGLELDRYVLEDVHLAHDAVQFEELLQVLLRRHGSAEELVEAGAGPHLLAALERDLDIGPGPAEVGLAQVHQVGD